MYFANGQQKETNVLYSIVVMPQPLQSLIQIVINSIQDVWLIKKDVFQFQNLRAVLHNLQLIV